jgi:hypothetical protein
LKYIISALLSLALVVALTGGCSVSRLSNPSSTPVKVEKEAKYHKGLASIFPSQTSKKEIRYQGMNEYGYVQTLERVFDTKGMRIVNYKGWMEDGIGGSKKERQFYVDYYVTENEVKEGVKNLDTYNPDKTNRLQSIIPKQIVLQAPLELHHSWTQKFEYKIPVKNQEGVNQKGDVNKEEVLTLTATHTISKIETKKGHPVFTVETVVKDIPGYYHNTYEETKTWQVGKGLTSFTQSLPLYEGFEGNEEDAKNLLLFGYSLVE